MPLTLSIRTKLVLFTTSIILLVGGGIPLVASTVLHRHLVSDFEENTQQLSHFAMSTLVDPLYYLEVDRVRFILEKALQDSSVISAMVLDSQGRILSDGSIENPQWLKKFETPVMEQMMAASAPVTQLQPGKIIQGHPIEDTSGKTQGFLYLEFSTNRVDHAIMTARRNAFFLTLLFLALGGALAWLLAWRATRPLTEMLTAVGAIGRGDLQTRIPVHHADEIGALAQGINNMTASLLQTTTSIEQLDREVAIRKRSEAELKQAWDEAEQSNRAKSEFLANMSHEIRTPMNAIINLSYLALQTGLTATQENYISKVKKSGESLLGIINDILDLSKVEAGKLEVEQKSFDLHSLLDDLNNILQVGADEKGIRLSIDTTAVLHPQRIGDPLRLKQILTNLLGNSIKFTAQGEVSLQIRELDDTQSMIAFVVSDTGIGISEEQQQKIFSPFIQADGSSTRKFGGTGLGLSISRHLATLMGGDITLNSSPGKGATFTLTLPLAMDESWTETTVTAQKTNRDEQLPLRRGASILLVEDNEVNQLVANDFLQQHGFVVSVANHGGEAIEKVKTEPFDLILMDVQMPVMDGFQATTAIRKLSQGRDIPIIAMTAHAMPEMLKRGMDAGMNGYLTKPVDIEALLDALVQWIPVREQPQPPRERQADDITTPQQIPGIDVSAGLKRIGGNWSAYKRVLSAFRQSNSDVGEKLKLEISTLDISTAKKTVHSLKGVAGTIGAMPLHQLALQLEKLLKDDADDYSAIVDQLQHELNRVFSGIDALT